MSRHMQTTCNVHEEICDHMVIMDGSYVEANYKIYRLTNSTCKTNEKLCDFMVIAHASHVVTR